MELTISIRDKKRIVHCPQWTFANFGTGSTIPVGDIVLSVCAKCTDYKGLKDIFTLDCGWEENTRVN